MLLAAIIVSLSVPAAVLVRWLRLRAAHRTAQLGTTIIIDALTAYAAERHQAILDDIT